MLTTFVEATQSIDGGLANHGKFLVGRFDVDERTRPSYLGKGHLLAECGWGAGDGYVIVMDLQTGEGAIFRPGGKASADLDKHRVWVCPMFEPTLEWLYRQDLRDLEKLPHLVELPSAEFAMAGYRRQGQGWHSPLNRFARIVGTCGVFILGAGCAKGLPMGSNAIVS